MAHIEPLDPRKQSRLRPDYNKQRAFFKLPLSDRSVYLPIGRLQVREDVGAATAGCCNRSPSRTTPAPSLLTTICRTSGPASAPSLLPPSVERFRNLTSLEAMAVGLDSLAAPKVVPTRPPSGKWPLRKLILNAFDCVVVSSTNQNQNARTCA